MTTVHPDLIVVGNWILPPGRKRFIQVIAQLSDPARADYFEFACLSASGASAVRLHRSLLIEVRADA
ncbi:hypothetical protein GCM10009719_16910 [Nocardioides kribbensis]